MLSKTRLGVGLILVLGMSFLTAGPTQAAGNPERSPALAEKEFRHPDLSIQAVLARPNELPQQAADQARQVLDALGANAEHAFLDVRAARWGTLLTARPMVPGDGVGNTLGWGDLGVAPPASEAALEHAAKNAFRAFLAERSAELDVDEAELAKDAKVTVAPGGAHVQIYVPRVVEGIPVRDSYLTAVLSHGNLVLFGAHQWGDVKVSRRPEIDAEEAFASAAKYLEPLFVSGSWAEPELVLVPVARGQAPEHVPFGQGYEYRLTWAVYPEVDGEDGEWEALVDAHNGEVLAFEDTRLYERRIQGGVYPVSNDGQNPDGVEQAGWPMPFDLVSTPGGLFTTDSGGNLTATVVGTITSQLSGQYVHMHDNCGTISLSSTADVDFGTSAGTDCATPGYGGAGNTHSSRSGFYELNRIKEMARGQLPANTWLQQQLTSNMNINSACNAYWSSGAGTVNFFRSNATCANTGEIAAVFDHEWGHGMDYNDATPGISNPGEGIADIYAALRLNTSCIGRGFWLSQNCTGYGDPCIDCTGIRDIDYAMRLSGLPHTFTWSNANCGGIVHCRGAVYAEAVWDLWKRDLTAAPYSMDDNTALEVTTRLTYLGAGGVGTWFSGTPPWGGCSATGGYMKFLAADDDNGNLNDGTPHMTAIYNAFNRHEIACSTPTVQNSGCTGTPATAPTVLALYQDRGALLAWNAVSGATRYQVFRTDSVFGCAFGKVKVGETTGTYFVDSGLQNGREYSYIVIPIGAADTCMGPASDCASVIPEAVPSGYYRCIVDIDAGVNACTGPEVTLTTNSGIYRVARIDMDGYLRMDAFVDVCSPSGYAVHFADSPSCNGWAGDSGQTTHDAETQLYYNDFSFWGTYDYSRGVTEPVVLQSDVVPATGCTSTQWSIQEDVLRFDDDDDPADTSSLTLTSFNSFELAPYDEPDSEDPTGLYADYWYAGLNRTVGTSSRSGTGVGRACFVLSNTENPDPAVLADLCAAN